MRAIEFCLDTDPDIWPVILESIYAPWGCIALLLSDCTSCLTHLNSIGFENSAILRSIDHWNDGVYTLQPMDCSYIFAVTIVTSLCILFQQLICKYRDTLAVDM